jgi:hypothetical protein
MAKRRICLYIVFFFVMFFSITSISATANNPAAMSLSYNLSSKTLTVEITHNVGDPNSHFVEFVEIRVNSSLITTETYTSQPTSSAFTYQYNINATEGDTIEVTAICSVSGSITRSLTVGSPEQGIPGYFGLLILLTASLLVLGFKTKRKLTQ